MLQNLTKLVLDNLEITKIVISIATPIIGAALTILIAYVLIFTDKTKFLNSELIKQRIAIYKELAPAINEIYCFINFVGHWQTLTPDRIIERKRACDREMHIYRALFDKKMFDKYQIFIKSCFKEFNGYGEPAKIKINVREAKLNWRSKWNNDWDKYLYDIENNDATLEKHYTSFMKCFSAQLGMK
ncbi:hypothetical protein PMNALOAF_1476 [Methylobacterium adhaesivum]|uniref:DUF4760 domain-containing protein n=1 Tax=Methylobacterium adhaesivum TaxID=333297 RepID=A0ABT8BN13_9HYPH|nr:hypothetical protein [Methylobacterium adhaesivum]MDN3592628.1 hypothetical protein [Methylobacterium adhaesivum]GJD30232.1 hypothetical protein PMNALOAF_1476 [Methylobacterium adhaesivum]